MSKKTKQIRVDPDDAFLIEQASRELASQHKREVTVREVFKELVKHVEDAKERIEK